jgi:hypothetical protein
MHLTIPPQDRILLMVAGLLVLFLVWIRLLARMNPGAATNRRTGREARSGVPVRSRAKVTPRWKSYLAAILLGNAAYYLLYPHLPSIAQHRKLVDFGTLVDLFLCVVFYALIEWGMSLIRRQRK